MFSFSFYALNLKKNLIAENTRQLIDSWLYLCIAFNKYFIGYSKYLHT